MSIIGLKITGLPWVVGGTSFRRSREELELCMVSHPCRGGADAVCPVTTTDDDDFLTFALM